MESMTTVQKRKNAEKAALQNELKYYSGLIAAHYCSAKMNAQNPNVQSSMTKNSTYSKTTANHGHHFKPLSFQHGTVTHLPNQNSNVTSIFTHHQLPKKAQISNSFNSRKYTYRSSMVKVNPSALSYKSLNTKKTSNLNNLHGKNHPDLNKQTSNGLVNINKPSGSNSQSLMDELGIIINELKQKTKHIDNKINHASSKAKSMNKCMLDKPELKVSTDSKIFCGTLNNTSQNIDLGDKKYNISSSSDSYVLPLSKSSNTSIFNEKEISQRKLPNMNDSLVKPLNNSRNDFPRQSNQDIVGKPCNKPQNLCTKLRNPNVLRVNNTIKTPGKKELIRKRHSSLKKLSGTTMFASKYKVVNKKLPYIEPGKKITLVSPDVKTTFKITPIKKHINSAKKIKSAARLITSKYKIINKKLPCVQSNSEKLFQGTSGDKVINNKCASLKTNKVQIKTNKLNSKYKIVNKKEKSVTVPTSIFVKKNTIAKEVKLSSFVHQRNKYPNKFKTSNASRKSPYTSTKLHGDGKIVKNIVCLKQNHIQFLNLKRKKYNSSRNFFMSNSKYKTVNKQHNRTLKKISGTAKSITLSNNLNNSIDLDLLMELASEKKDCNNPIINSPAKHILIKRVYKSKNAIVNKNASSLQTKVAKMIKTKYSILNKKHSWQKQGFTKRLISPKSFKGHKYQRRGPFYYTRNNSRRHVSTYFAGKSYSKRYFDPKTKSMPVGPFRSKRFVLNRKVYLKTQNPMKLNSPVSKTMASRVLNRSINRVLNASIKKKTSKVNIYCMFYNRFGRCNKGVKCPYVHDPSKIAVCTRFLRGTCKNKNCPFSHEKCPGKMAICSFFLSGSCTKKDCPYRHETLLPNAKLCKGFVEGYCPDGKQCKHAHVLVCPQFVQGHCEKGKACPFPHPPPKGKKTITNSSKKSQNLEETQELILENMSRYFECGYEPASNDIASITVPRIKNLPEQPSFIAL